MTGTDVTKPAQADTPSALRVALTNQLNVLHALVLHDIKSRFFGNGYGYIVTVIWPFAHLGVIMAIFIIGRRATPFGNSSLLYIATGVYPFIIFNYISRFAMLGIVTNRHYLNYPTINLLDIIAARILLEINTAYIILILLCLFLFFNGVSVMPLHLQRALLGVFSAAIVGMGCGVLGGVITCAAPLFTLIWIGPVIACYATSGILFNPETLPQQIAELFYWNPILHSVEMVRSAYYPDYPTSILDIKYPFIVGFSTLTMGLLAERLYSRYLK